MGGWCRKFLLKTRVAICSWMDRDGWMVTRLLGVVISCHSGGGREVTRE